MTEPRSPHRAWIEVDHAAIRSNLAAIRERVPGAGVIGVVKANAYGHGDVAVARTLVGAGVERLAVATVDEGVALRHAGIDVPLLVLWGIGASEAGALAEARLEPIVYDARSVELLDRAGANVCRVHR
jgi:alanine racemase